MKNEDSMIERLKVVAEKNGHEPYRVTSDAPLIKRRLIKFLPRGFNAAHAFVAVTTRGLRFLARHQ